ncbi:MAG: SRPBCC family protein [Syntrophothermus sp.]
MASFTIVRHVAAPPGTVFEVLTDHGRYAEFTPVRRSELERQGDPPPNGVGAIRALTSVGPPLREEVLTFEPPTRFSYRLLSGAPLRDHVGTVELEAEGTGTRMVYAVRTFPNVPLVGPLLVAVVRRAVAGLAGGIASESERRAAPADAR